MGVGATFSLILSPDGRSGLSEQVGAGEGPASSVFGASLSVSFFPDSGMTSTPRDDFDVMLSSSGEELVFDAAAIFFALGVIVGVTFGIESN